MATFADKTYVSKLLMIVGETFIELKIIAFIANIVTTKKNLFLTICVK